MFVTGIITLFGLALVVIASIVFFSQPKEVSKELVFNKPKISVDFSVFGTSQFKELEPSVDMEIRFYYEATVDGKEKEGYISAESKEAAKDFLEKLEYQVDLIKEMEIGRDNPFQSYELDVDSEASQIEWNQESEESEEEGINYEYEYE